MSFIVRGAKNTFRNAIRTFSIVVILALSTGLALTMLLSREAVQSKIDEVKGSIGNIITISPAGARGFEGGGEPLTSDQADKVKAMAHVSSVTETLGDRLTSENSNLVSSIDAGSLGRRNNSSSGSASEPAPPAGGPTLGGTSQRSFTPPVFLTGLNSLDGSVLSGGGSINLTNGDKFDPTQDAAVALVGKELAAKNSLSVGSSFMAYGTTATVKGIFDSGNAFANNAVVMPLPTVQRLSAQPNQVSSIIVQVDSISNLETTTTAIKNTLGSAADVVSAQDTSSQALTPLENIKSISMYSLIGAVVSAAVILFLAMLMIVRERRREIGVFKAIGASNIKIVLQFMSEAVVLTLLGSVVGVVSGALLSNSVVKVLVSSNTTTGGGGGRAGGGFGRLLLGGQNTLQNIHTAIGYNIILYGIMGAFLIAIIGSAIPAYLIAKVRPAEVMRGE